MRLAIVTHNVIKSDGQGQVAYEAARYARAQGAAVTLLADQVEPDLLKAGAQWVPLHPRPHKMHLLKVREIAGLADRALTARAGQFDVVQGFGYTLTRPHQVNVSQFVHDAWRRSPAHTVRVRRDAYGLYQWAYTLLNARWERRAYRQAQVVVAASEQVRRELMAAGVAPERIRVIWNAASPQAFQSEPGDRRALGLPDGVPLALFVGDIRTPRKNLDTVLRALAQTPGAHLAVVGATEGSPYPQRAARQGVAERVHFLGFRRDVAQVMQAADLFVFPSRYEPFGIVVLEAMAAGLPVVTVRTVGASDLVTPACGVVLPDTENAGALARAMQSLLSDRVRRAQMGQAARAVAEQHTWARMGQDYWNLYCEMAP